MPSFNHFANQILQNIELIKLRFVLLFLILPGLVISSTALANSKPLLSPPIQIQKVYDYQQDKQLLIDSESLFNLPSNVIDAIHHEITLSFKTQIELTESSQLLGVAYQRKRNYLEYDTQLYAYGVNRLYALYNTRNKKAQSFKTLDEALQTLATLQAFPIASLSELHPEQRYTLRMRISLNHWQLPAPLLLQAIFTPDWALDSQWYETTLQTPLSWQ